MIDRRTAVNLYTYIFMTAQSALYAIIRRSGI